MGLISGICLAQIAFKTVLNTIVFRGVLRGGSFSFSKQKKTSSLVINVSTKKEQLDNPSNTFNRYRNYGHR